MGDAGCVVVVGWVEGDGWCVSVSDGSGRLVVSGGG